MAVIKRSLAYGKARGFARGHLMKKRLLSACLFCCLLLTLVSPAAFASETTSGTCGDGLTWTLDAKGKLTVSGKGAMTDYKDEDGNRSPWYAQKDKIVSVTLENGVTSVGAYSFADCANLTSLSLPNTLKSLKGGSFARCPKLNNVTIPDSVTTISPGVFYRCFGLSAMTIPANVTSIGDGAFSGCTKLTEIKVAAGNKNYVSVSGILFNADKTRLICYPAGKSGNYIVPYSVTDISAYAFYGATQLDSVTPHNEVINIGNFAFAACSKLSLICLPKFLSSIGERAFSDCAKLRSVTIPVKVTEIADNAFKNCSALENAYYAGSEKQWKAVKVGAGNDVLSSAVKFDSPTNTITIVALDDERSQTYASRECPPQWVYNSVAPTPRAGYHFEEWVGLSGLTLKEGDAKTKTVKFTMPAKDLTLTAKYEFFIDVKPENYFYNPVRWAVGKSITNGTTEATFSPGNVCTTANILTFLWRANGSPTPSGGNPFSNVDSNAYYAKAAAWAYEKGMISGNTFDGDAPCTRAATMKYLWILAGRPKTGKLPFRDVDPKADYAWAVAWAVDSGITKGTSDTTFSPDNTCTRGQIVTFLYRHYAQ